MEYIIAWYCDFKREQQKWFIMLVDSEYHRQKIGTQLLSKGKKRNDELNGWIAAPLGYKKENGEDYKSPLNFYLKNEFEVHPEDKFETKIKTIKIKWNQQMT